MEVSAHYRIMASLFFITRGIKKDVDEFITELQGKYLPFKWSEKDGEPLKDTWLQLSVRPIQLWEVGFPKEHYDLVANTILGSQNGFTGNDGNKTVFMNFPLKTFALRKILGAKALTPWKTDNIMPISKGAIHCLGIGTKDDYTLSNGMEGI